MDAARDKLETKTPAARRRLDAVLVGTMLAACALPILLFGGIGLVSQQAALREEAADRLRERVRVLQLQIDAELAGPIQTLRGFVRDEAFAHSRPEQQATQLAWALARNPSFLAIAVPGPSGSTADGLRVPAAGQADQEVEDLFRLLQSIPRRPDLDVRTAAGFSRVRGEPVLGVRASLLPVPEAPAADVAALVSLKGLQAILASASAGGNGRAWVFDEAGRVVAHPAPAKVQARESLRRPGPVPRVEELNLDGGRALVAVAALSDLPWGVVLEEPLAQAYALGRAQLATTAAGMAAAILLASLFVVLFLRRTLRPLRDLRDGALRIARGQVGAKIEVSGAGEFADLVEVLNYMSQQLLAYESETRGLYRSLEEGYLETMVALTNSIESKDRYTRGHSQRVGEMASEIGRELGLTEMEVKHCRLGGLLHDIGKIGVVEPILHKAGSLTDEEMGAMRAHPSIGANIVEAVSFLRSVLPAVKSHHERWDGTGYPEGLKGAQIPVLARVVSGADTWDACTSTRPYQAAMPSEKALEVMRKLRGATLDPDVVDALERVVRKKLAKGERVSSGDEPTPAKAAGG